MPPVPDASTPLIARRGVLAGAGACALALLGAGCGSSDEPASADRDKAPPSTSSAPADPPVGSLAAVADVPVGGGKVVGEVLLVQPAAGTIKAYDARCPHKGTIVRDPDADGVVVCPSHSARFKSDDGSVIDGPSKSGLQAIPVKVTEGQVLRV